ncbi:unnamed protein product [Paramecium sonneborni]|uniref:RING-type domain-containing protein n=1 Tax=Paramecium sonneborni TaxID=65129 RepID=A0A8S1R7W4_9CILI|nr:unnamed protein product [Paramecium sonneborni]
MNLRQQNQVLYTNLIKIFGDHMSPGQGSEFFPKFLKLTLMMVQWDKDELFHDWFRQIQYIDIDFLNKNIKIIIIKIMNTTFCQISPIQKNIQIYCNNFKSCINVGSLLNFALFLGLIEYHIKVNKVEDIKRIYEKVKDSSSAQIKSIIQNSENQKQKLESILTQIRQQSQIQQKFDIVMGSYFQHNAINNDKEKDKDLQNKIQYLEKDFKIKFQVWDSKKNQKILNIDPSTIYIIKNETNYYLLLYNMECSKCGNKQNLQNLKCSHKACFTCIQNQFEQKLQPQSINCFEKGCYIKIEKQQYVLMKTPRQQLKKGDNLEKSIKNDEKLQEQQNVLQQNIKNINTEQHLQKNTLNKETQLVQDNIQQSKIKIEQKNFEQEKQQNKQNEQKEQPLQYENLNINEKTKKNIDSNNNIKDNCPQIAKEEEEKTKQQIDNVKCSQCQKDCRNENFEASCGHNYCTKCFEILQSKKFQYTCLHPKCNKIKQYKQIEQEKLCHKCSQIKDDQTLFTNFCGHQICVQCLEILVKSKRNLTCPKCSNGLQSEEIELFFENLQFQIYEKEIKNKVSNQDKKDFSTKQMLQNQTNQKNCTLCFSPFTDYNLQQLFSHCQNPSHTIGVCCTIFPLECPQCQMSSLEIQKYQIIFEIRNNQEFYDMQY